MRSWNNGLKILNRKIKKHPPQKGGCFFGERNKKPTRGVGRVAFANPLEAEVGDDLGIGAVLDEPLFQIEVQNLLDGEGGHDPVAALLEFLDAALQAVHQNDQPGNHEAGGLYGLDGFQLGQGVGNQVVRQEDAHAGPKAGVGVDSGNAPAIGAGFFGQGDQGFAREPAPLEMPGDGVAGIGNTGDEIKIEAPAVAGVHDDVGQGFADVVQDTVRERPGLGVVGSPQVEVEGRKRGGWVFLVQFQFEAQTAR